MKKVSNEISKLKKVVIHRPDEGLERVTPDTALEFLYDDITYLPEMQEEHDIFTDTIKAILSPDAVIETQDLLLSILNKNAEARKQLLDAVQKHENIPDDVMDEVKHLSAKDLNYFLFNGVNPKSGKDIMPPLPNYVFTRDIGVVINDHLLICQASKIARMRENVISRTIFYHHKEFKDYWSNDKIIDLTVEKKEIAVEGGDVMVLNPNYVLIGQSERTSHDSIDRLRTLLFEKNVIENVVTVDIPDTRSYMHIDTVFTQISQNEFVAYDRLMNNPEQVKFCIFDKTGLQDEYLTLQSFLNAVLNQDVNIIQCGNGLAPYDEREQWTDGCNLVAIRMQVIQ